MSNVADFSPPAPPKPPSTRLGLKRRPRERDRETNQNQNHHMMTHILRLLMSLDVNPCIGRSIKLLVLAHGITSLGKPCSQEEIMATSNSMSPGVWLFWWWVEKLVAFVVRTAGNRGVRPPVARCSRARLTFFFFPGPRCERSLASVDSALS